MEERYRMGSTFLLTPNKIHQYCEYESNGTYANYTKISPK